MGDKILFQNDYDKFFGGYHIAWNSPNGPVCIGNGPNWDNKMKFDEHPFESLVTYIYHTKDKILLKNLAPNNEEEKSWILSVL